MKTIGASKFKAQCLELLDELDDDGSIVTMRGKPIARVVPYGRGFADFIGSLRDKIKVHGDIESTGKRWNAES